MNNYIINKNKFIVKINQIATTMQVDLKKYKIKKRNWEKNWTYEGYNDNELS